MTAGERRAAGRWARADLQRRGLAFVGVGMLFGVVAAVGAAFLAGAQRTGSAFDRFHESARGGDALVFVGGAGLGEEALTSIVDLPVVDRAVAYAEIQQRWTVAGDDDHALDLVALFPVAPPGLYETIEVPQLVDGRSADPERDDEVVITTAAREDLGLSIGDVVVLETQLPGFDDPDNFNGPTFELTVVGVGRTPLALSYLADEPVALPTAAVLDRNPDIPRGVNLVVTLSGGAAGVPTLRDDLLAEADDPIPVIDLAEASDRLRDGISFERSGLLLLALGVLLAGYLIAAQPLVRLARPDEQTLLTLRALGFSRTGRVLALGLPSVLAGLSAVATMGAGAIALSPRFPVGLARQLEIDPGLHVDASVLVVSALVLVVVLAIATVAGVGLASARPEPPIRRTTLVGRGVAAGGLPVVVELGARFALEPPSARERSPLRPIVACAALGLGGAVAAATVGAGIADAVREPARAGQWWDGDYVAEDPDALVDELLARDDVRGVARSSYTIAEIGDTSFAVFTLESVRGRSSFSLGSGRAPNAAGEIALGAVTARRLGAEVGDDIRIGSGRDIATLRVVGTCLAPQVFGSAFDEGAWVTPQGMERVGPLSFFGDASITVLADFDPSTPLAEVDQFLTADQGPVDNVLDPEPPVVASLRGVRGLPGIEGAFFAALALGSLAHLLRTTVRRRRGDLGVLRALGMTHSQTIGLIGWQGLTLGVVALLVGVPLGLGAGGWVWHLLAGATGLLDVAPLPGAALLVVGPLTLLTAGTVALGAARLALRRPLRPNDPDLPMVRSG